METNPPQNKPSILKGDRQRFLRKAICDAQLEFGQLETQFKILEAALLTAMGTLGIVRGFNGMLQPDEDDVKMVCRGMDSATIAFVRENFQKLDRHYFSSGDTSPYPFQVDIHIIPTDPRGSDPLSTSEVRLLVGWHLGKALIGLTGLGAKIIEGPFLDDEIDFFYNLTDHMVLAMQSISTKSVFHTLENELDQARQRAGDSILHNEAAKKELEETLFRFSGFNDIFHELSGLKESSRVVDAFMLVLLGIFSARNGYIFYWDDVTQKAYAASRGIDPATLKIVEPATVREQLEAVFESPQVANLGAMQAAMLPSEQLNALHPFSSNSSIAILFRVDGAAKGFLCLGERVVETQYGASERELLLAFTHNFLVFLKNSKSFETIQRLNAEQEQKNIALEETVEALSASRSTIAGLEKTGERIKAAIARAMARSTRVSVLDVALILIFGTVLGLVYNFASPSGIQVIPQIWRRPPSPQINISDTKRLVDTQAAILVDARPQEFYKQQHIHGALNLPPALFDFIYMMRIGQFDPQKPIVVYGRTISRHYDEEIAYELIGRGHQSVSVLAGGLKAWQANGLALSP